MTGTPPPSPPPAPTPPSSYANYAPQRDSRPVSFYVAVFLALLLLVSGALNLVLLVFSVFGSATGAFGSGAIVDDGGAMYQMVAVGGDQGAKHNVMRVPIQGAIAEAASPLLGAAGGTVSQVRRALRAVERDDSIKGVLLDINSPGGGVTDSDEIWRLITEFRKEHPEIKVVAVLGDMATSGGYYIAVACDAIVARPTTTTGSIGVIISSYNVSKAMAELGIEDVTIVSPDTPYKDMLSPTRAAEPEEVEKIRAIVQEMYERFVDVVDRGRPGLDRDEVKSAATGEIYSANQALAKGLVDKVGSIDEAYDLLESLVGLETSRMVEYRRVPTFFDSLFQVRSPAPIAVDQVLGQLLRSATGPRLLYYWRGGR